MKILRIIVALLLVSLLVVFSVGCDGSDDASNDTTRGNTSENSDKTDKDGDGVKLYVEYNGTKIKLGAKADDIISALGEPQSKREIGDCGGLGAQVEYTYPSVVIYVLESKTDGNIIDQITFRDDIISTPEGVCIGDTVADAKKALGAPTSESAKALLYTSGKYTLKLSINGDAISEINYITSND